MMITIIALISGVIGLGGTFYKLSSSIATFSIAVKNLEKSVSDSVEDRKDLRKSVIDHDKKLGQIDMQFDDVKDDIKEVKEDLKEIKKEVKG